jgi:uncharacterized protein (DUF697 family)/uncharacterized tellurite resistance protein B-like protein
MTRDMRNEDVLAGIQVLVAMAQADGTIHEAERLAIENALEGAELPDGQTASQLLESTIDLDAVIETITDADVRTRTYDAACAIVYVDGHVSDEERALLGRLRKAFGIADDPKRDARFEKFTSIAPAPEHGSETDPKKRGYLVDEEIARAAAFSAFLSRTTLPIAAESCLFTNHVRLARNIGVAYGREADESFYRTFVTNIAGAAAPWFAVSSLLRLLPGARAWTNAYATTIGIGEATRRYFEDGEKADADALRDVYAESKEKARERAKDALDRITALEDKIAPAKKDLDAELSAKKLEDTAYADRLVALG